MLCNWGSTNSVGPINRSLFGPNFSRSAAMVTDGVSNTLMASEGYIGHAQMRSCLTTPTAPSDSSVGMWSPFNVPAPGAASTKALTALIGSCSTASIATDWDSVDENDGGPTDMSLSASSFHPGGVNTLFADGSVRYAKSSISAVTWRNLGTIAGGEVVSADSF